ncbi:Receptor-like serine/threonine-protein kinase [Actinidia chinensis var. chinensis]|uniref:non-specific serine/threonine protein kinase n=1 Tax=Actinidia chinensis var. chinensis TaxID=1590841 RepID=A0A2R6QA14_ACTCC|nr:Receptor-like serine/threonine-protein kinase [Actinidia chinensis var. chinensis]
MDRAQTLISIILTSTVTGIALLTFLAACCMSKIESVKRQAQQESNPSGDTNANREENLEFRLFDMNVISAATNNFATDCKIGQGGFGPVYKGELPTGEHIAVKRLSRSSRQGLEEFENESSVIARLQHRNLVKLIGCCVHGDERMLIYEYLQNKSLDKFIFEEGRKRLLLWAKRFDIILGIAKGLAYLHDGSRLIVVHRDLKASNILLDREMMPKISDFGLAKILEGGDESQETTRRLIGTHGYMSPEYAMHGQFSTKSDVFSFGVLVLEIISGQRNWGFQHPDHDLNLLGYGWKLWRDGNALELVDSALEDSISEIEVLRCIQVGLLCVQQRSEDRPTMWTVLCMLGNECAEFPEPTEPGFFAGHSSRRQQSVSINGLTISTISSR